MLFYWRNIKFYVYVSKNINMRETAKKNIFYYADIFFNTNL